MFSVFRSSPLAILILATFTLLSFLKGRAIFRKALFLTVLLHAMIAGAQAQVINGFTGRYLATDLGALGQDIPRGSHDNRDYSINDINDLGQIVGEQFGHCFRTAPYSPINPSTDYLNPPGTGCQALAINDLGQVVGSIQDASGYHAFRTAPNSTINPATDYLTSQADYAVAHDINNLGQVVGVTIMRNEAGQAVLFGFRTQPNAAVDLTTDYLGLDAWAYAINDSGVAVGYIRPLNGGNLPWVGFRTTPNNEPLLLSSLGSYGGDSCIGYDINNNGQIVGTASMPRGEFGGSRAFFLEPNQILDPNNPSFVSHWFGSVNSFGTTVGANDSSGGALYYSNGVVKILNYGFIIQGGVWLEAARAINDSGHIVAVGYYNGEWHGFLLTPYIDRIPPTLTVPSNITVAASSSLGAEVTYSTSAIDDYFNPASINCNHPSGSLFPIGSTVVSCTATDGVGNISATKSFNVIVVDSAPNLSLPPYISTSATSASGATVTYFASADDAVSGQLPATCFPVSGSVFPIGQTTVSCSATDGAGNTSTGSFEVYVLTSDQTYTPPDGYNVTVQPNNSTTITYGYVETPGVTTVQPIDAATIGTTPAGFALSNGIAYQISTTAGVYFDWGIELIFAVPGPISEADFNNLRILHNNNGTLEDVTYYGEYNPETQSGNIHAYTYSFSPFYLAKQVDKKISPLFNQTTAHKIGSTIPIKLRVLNGSNANISSNNLALKARNLVRLGTNTASVVIDAGNSNPDFNFRYDSGLQGYVFNLKTTGLTAGKYVLSFYAGSDRSFFYTVEFEVK